MGKHKKKKKSPRDQPSDEGQEVIEQKIEVSYDHSQRRRTSDNNDDDSNELRPGELLGPSSTMHRAIRQAIST
jgi:hypothetical protein